MPARSFLIATAALAIVLALPLATAPFATAYAQDADEGARVFRRCAACHTTEEGGRNRVGPNLFGVIEAVSGTRETGFNYSPALREAAITWTDENLDQWLTNPRTFIKGTRMPLGIANQQQRLDVIAYLKEVTQ